MPDKVTYGPFTLYESDAYKAKKNAEAIKTILDLEKSQLELQKLKQENPDYQIERAGNLATQSENIQGLIGNINNRTDADKQKLADIAASITPLPSGVAGPVLPEQAVAPERGDIEARLASDMSTQNRLRSQLEAVRKQQEGLQGSVNLGENFGTAPAGDANSVITRRTQEAADLMQRANSFVSSAQTPEQRDARLQAVQMFKPMFDAETRRRQKAALEIAGLQGQALDEDAAKNARTKTTDFVGSVKALDMLMAIKPQQWSQITDPIEREGQRRKADTLRAALVGNLRIALAGPGQLSEYERKIIESAIANPASFDPVTSMYASQNLGQLKKVLASKYVSDMSTYGFKINRLQDVIDAGGNPADIDTFGFNNNPTQPSTGSTQKTVGRYDPATGRIIPNK